MFQLNEELDYENILKTCSIQDFALKQSREQTKNCEKGLQTIEREYIDVMEKTSDRKNKHQQFRSKMAEKLNSLNSFEQLKLIQDKQHKKKLNVVSRIRKDMNQNVDSFVFEITSKVKSFQNLGLRFDETTIMEQVTKCIKENCTVTSNVSTLEMDYQNVKDLDQDKTIYPTQLYNLKKMWPPKLNYSKLTDDVIENEARLSLVNKNIDFLKRTENNGDLDSVY